MNYKFKTKPYKHQLTALEKSWDKKNYALFCEMGTIKNIVYEMRFDEVSARFADFGDFYIGMQLPLNELFKRICL